MIGKSNAIIGGGGVSVLTGDAAIADVLNGKTFYADDPASKLTGTLGSDSDAVVDDVVTGKIFNGVGAARGVGTRFPLSTYIKSLASAFVGVALPASVTINAPQCTNPSYMFNSVTGCTALDVTFSNSITTLRDFLLLSSIVTLTLGSSTASCTVFRTAFATTSLVTINGALNLTAASDVTTPFNNASALVTVTFTPNTIPLSLSLASSPNLSDASLVSLANGLKQAGGGTATLTLHATAKTAWNAIRGTISGSAGTWVFTDDAGTDTLATFIDADHKNWVIP